MSARIVFLDTETTSLRPDRRAWEVGLIIRDPGQPDEQHQRFIHADDLDLGNADVMSLKIGRFYTRHPQFDPNRTAMCGVNIHREQVVLREVEQWTRGAHIVGAVPNFDTEVLGARMRANGICPSWHYHLVDIEALAVGCLAAKIAASNGAADPGLIGLPWQSDMLSAALGVTVSEEDRHTALGDAKWARAVYDAVTGHG